MKNWLKSVGAWFEGLTPAKQLMLGQLLALALGAAGAPPYLRQIVTTGVAIVAGASAAPVVVPPVQVQIGEVPDILRGIVPSEPETSSRDTQGPPDGSR